MQDSCFEMNVMNSHTASLPNCRHVATADFKCHFMAAVFAEELIRILQSFPN